MSDETRIFFDSSYFDLSFRADHERITNNLEKVLREYPALYQKVNESLQEYRVSMFKSVKRANTSVCLICNQAATSVCAQCKHTRMQVQNRSKTTTPP